MYQPVLDVQVATKPKLHNGTVYITMMGQRGGSGAGLEQKGEGKFIWGDAVLPHEVEEEGRERRGGGVGVCADEGVIKEGSSVRHLVEHFMGVAYVTRRRHRSEAEELAENHRVVMEARAKRVGVEEFHVAHARAPLCHVDEGVRNSGGSHCCCNAMQCNATLLLRFPTSE